MVSLYLWLVNENMLWEQARNKNFDENRKITSKYDKEESTNGQNKVDKNVCRCKCNTLVCSILIMNRKYQHL